MALTILTWIGVIIGASIIISIVVQVCAMTYLAYKAKKAIKKGDLGEVLNTAIKNISDPSKVFEDDLED